MERHPGNGLARRLFERLLPVSLRGPRKAGGPAGAAEIGRWGERAAEAHLRARGYRILGRRVRTAHREEIDLVAAVGDTLVFVEVKTRAGETYGRPFDAVDRTKRLQVSKAAARYIKRLRRPPPFSRFDVVEVIGTPDRPPAAIRHLENAFPPEAGIRLP